MRLTFAVGRIPIEIVVMPIHQVPHSRRQNRPPIGRRARSAAAVVAGRASGALARRLRLGGGTSLPGLVANRLDPEITAYLGAQLRHGCVVVTGTNGKTTSSGLIASVLRAARLRVWRNREGANLARGITASLVIRALPTGNLRRGGNAVAVFEVDEASFPQVMRELRPRAVVVTNLFRDQLDRYGEVDTVAERWRNALADLSTTATLILNADDPAVAALADADPLVNTIYYGVDEAPAALLEGTAAGEIEVVDTRTCPRCHGPLTYSVRFYSHVGHWACPSCGFARPTPAVRARELVADGLDGMSFLLETPSGAQEAHIGLPGFYNVYNALAAAAVGLALNAPLATTITALGSFKPAFGRAERIAVGERAVRLLLAKNPTGMNETLRALATGGRIGHIMLALNDYPADGEDVSWIWDADIERLRAIVGPDTQLTVSGVRAYDLALRLKYAEIAPQHVEPEIPKALAHALAQTPAGDTLVIIPTYTALLAVRGELERQGYAPHYWEQRDVGA